LLDLCDQTLTKQHRIYEMLLKQGKVFENPTETPVEAIDEGNCYDNAYQYAVEHKLKYCEGYAFNGMPREHAWCVKRGKNVVDPTWGLAGSDYFGYIVDLDSVKRPSPAFVLTLVAAAPGCSLRKVAVHKLADALAGSGTTFSSDDDPDLIESAVPFSLKLIESLLAESPNHRGMLLAASSGFTQYAY